MTNEEELINVDRIDVNNHEAMEEIRTYIARMLDDVYACMKRMEERHAEAINKINGLLDRSDVDKIERKKTIFSKLLYIIGSAFSPELMPVDMYDKQVMPEKSRRRFNELHEEANTRKKSIEKADENLRKYEMLHQQFREDILRSNEKLINYFRAFVDTYTKNKMKNVPKNMMDVFLYVLSLNRSGYLDLEQVRELSECIVIEDGHLTNGFGKFNELFVKKYGNGAKTK